MEAHKSRDYHFRKKIGSSATRADSRGDSEFGEVDLQSSMFDQLNRFMEGRGTDQEFDRQGGNYRKTLHAQQREAFEKIFVAVASARLPKDIFLQLQEEARRIWRGEYSDLVPPSHRQMRKIRKFRRKQAALTSDQG